MEGFIVDFIDQLKQFSIRTQKMKEKITTEEATKTAMILPFFQMLGYDVFNPLEFVPEYTADVGIKKGEKVDYAIMGEDENPLILIEAKWCGDTLDKHGSQLFRYFSTTSAKFGILTNGIIYQFYTDLDEPNKMDEKPFLEFNLEDIKESLVNELKKFQKTSFDVETIFTTASELKYSGQIKQLLAKQLAAPSDSFITCMIEGIYEGRKTQNVIDKFRDIVKKSFNQFINELINDRLKSALATEAAKEEAASALPETQEPLAIPEENLKITPSAEQLECFYMIKALLHDVLGENTITYKCTETYLAILLNGNSRKWICRIQVSELRISLALPTEGKKPVKYILENIDGLFSYKDHLAEIIMRYCNCSNAASPVIAED